MTDHLHDKGTDRLLQAIHDAPEPTPEQRRDALDRLYDIDLHWPAPAPEREDQ